MSAELYDLLIIGAGPSGLSCAIEAQRRGLKYLLIDKGGIVHTIQQFQRDLFFFSTPELLNIGDVPFVIPTHRPTTLDCLNYYTKVAEIFKLKYSLFHEVIECARRDGNFVLHTSTRKVFSGRALVVATGYYDNPNPLGVPGENLPHVSHYYRDPFPYYGQNVLIVGAKNSAVEAALDLHRHGARVTVVHRGSALSPGIKYWILPDFENRVQEGSIKLHLNTTVKEFCPGITTLQFSPREVWNHETGFALVLIGYRPNISFLRSLGIQIDPDTLAPIHNPQTMETNIAHLYVAGGLVGGRFNNKVFIENGREHGKKIVAALQG